MVEGWTDSIFRFLADHVANAAFLKNLLAFVCVLRMSG